MIIEDFIMLGRTAPEDFANMPLDEFNETPAGAVDLQVTTRRRPPPMATAAQQARFRARDLKRTIEVRLSPEAVTRLNKLVVQTGARGMGDALERLLLAEGRGEPPAWLLNEAIRLGRGYLRLSGTDEGTLRDTTGWYYTIRRER